MRPRLQTASLQAAIDNCFLAGGGEVTVPAGVFRIGGLRLRSSVTLHLLQGAILQGSRDPDDYFILEKDTVEPFPKKLISHAGAKTEPSNKIYGKRWMNSMLRGFTVQHSANWAENIRKSRDVLCEDITNIAGHDGVHITSCNDVIIRSCKFYTGDGCVAGFDNQNILVEDCILNTACSALRFGGTNVLVTRCRIFAPAVHPFRGFLSVKEKKAGINATDAKPENRRNNMLSVFTYYGDCRTRIRKQPGNIVIRDCVVDGADRFLHFNYSGNEPWQNNRPQADITFENITADNISMPLTGYGDPATPFALSFANVKIRFRPGCEEVDFMHLAYFKRLTFEYVSISGNRCEKLLKSWSAPGKIICKDLTVDGKPVDAANALTVTQEPFTCQPI